MPFPSPGDPPDPGTEPTPSALAGGFFTTEPAEKPQERHTLKKSCFTQALDDIGQYFLGQHRLQWLPMKK